MSVTGETEDSEIEGSPEDSIGTVNSETQNLRAELERISKELNDRKRELEVEAALEKVRSKAMSIQRSEDLRTVVQILYEQLRNLGFQWGVASITIMDQETGDIDWWMEGFGDGYVLPECYHVPFFDHPGHMQQLNPWKNGAPYAEIEISGQEKKSYDAYYFFKTDFARAPESSKQLMMQQETVRFSMAYMKYGALSWSPSTLSKEQATILERFAKVFEQCYTRFLDLQKAEAQAREAQIEAALEKIRSRSLAMHHSGELREVITIFFEKLNELGVLLGTVGIALLDQQTKHLWYWVGNTIQDPQLVSAPYDKSMMGGVNFLSDSHIAIANRKEILNQTYTKEQKDRYFEHLFSHNDLTQIPEGAREVLRKMESHVVCFFPNKHSSLFADSWDGKKYSEDGIGILRRAARVFEQTYVRFLDLEKAEAQAREAQIETALEKVRSKSLAMHRSEELQEVVTTVFDRLKELDIQTDAINLDVFNENKKDAYLWTAVPGQNYSKAIHIPYTDSAIFKDIYDGMISGKLLHSKVYSRELKDEFLNYLFGHTDFREIPQERKDLLYSSDASTVSVAYAKNTAIIAQRYRNNPFSDDENEILKRFAKVFDQAYTRFLDLQKAEAQAREAQIEAALEKVRSSSLAMHNSDELKEVVKTVVEKIQDLDIEMNGGISMVTFEAGSHDFRHWLWIPGRLEDTFTAKVVGFDHPILADCRKAQDQGLELFSKVYGKKDKQRYFKHVFEKTDFKYGPKETKDWVMQQPFFGFSFAIQKHSGIFLNDYSGKYFSKETNDILVRFSRVFEQAYVRFLDLQKAEAQAREAQIEAALEKVRSRSLAMHHSSELEQVVGSLFDRLVELGLSFDGAGIFEFDPENRKICLWIATTHLAAPARIHLPWDPEIEKNRIWIDLWHAFEKRIDLFHQTYSGKAKNDYFQYVAKYNPLPEAVRAIHQEKNWTAYFASSKYTLIGFDSWSGHVVKEEDFKVMRRFAAVFDQSYTRFLDLQKAEAQAREAQIEAALERVRSQTMAMHKSEDLLKVITVVSEQLQHLNFKFNTVSFAINSQSHDYTFWFAILGDPTPIYINVPYIESPMFDRMKDVLAEGIDFYADTLTPEENRKWHEHVFDHAVLPSLTEETKAYILRSGYARSIAIKPSIMLIVSNYAGKPYSDSENEIIKRFGTVFEQSYTRFLDLQKAEAQARESQVQLALERVRARTMAMQRSEELNDAASLLFQQVQSLGAPSWTAGYCIFDEDKRAVTLWVCGPWGDIQPSFRVPLDENPSFINYLNAYNKNLELYIEENSAKVNEENYQYLLTIPVVSERLKSIIAQGLPLPTYQVDHCAYFSKGFLLFITYQKVPELHGVFKRFAAVFDQTYTRFLDLQKAESQAREAQIEAALERVRARTMGLQKSEELRQVVKVLYTQLKELGFDGGLAGIIIMDPDSGDVDCWAEGIDDGYDLPEKYHVPYFEHPAQRELIKHWKSGAAYAVVEIAGQEKKSYNNYFFFHTDFAKIPEATKQFMMQQEGLMISMAYMQYGALNWSPSPISDEQAKILQRFAKVFEQTYTRFLDLQKSEAQAREAQIEAALERVRARTMAMHNSSELIETAELLFDQLKQLGAESQGVAFAICEKENIMVQKWTSIGVFSVPYTYEPGEQRMYEAWKSQTEIYEEVYEGEKLKKYYELFMEIPEFKQGIQKFIDSGYPLPAWQKNHAIPFKYGYLLLITTKPFEEKHIFTRFAKVFEQTYTRFLDLQKAEGQARESQIQLALERVRARTMAMQHSDELAEAAFVLFQQLQALGIVHERINIGIVKEESNSIDFWITEQGGNQINTRFSGRIDEPTTLSKMYLGWKKNQKSMVIDQTGEDLENWLRYLKEEIGIPFDPAFLHHRRVQTVGFFSKGMLVVTTPEPLPEENLGLLVKFAGVFDLTYTRFSDLKQAEAQAREAQIEVALERIRTRALAMQSSTELSDVANVLREQMGILGQEDLEASVVHLYSADSPTFDSWYAFRAGDKIIEGQITFRLENSALAKEFLRLYLDEITDYTIEVKGAQLEEWLAEIKRNAPQIAAYWGDLPPEKQFYHFSDFSGGALLMVSHQNLSEETRMLQKRCALVFELAYKRYLDLEAKERQDMELREEKQRLEKALSELKATQSQLIQSEKMASLGQLTAGIAHEIKNPLNFVNNFSEVSIELIGEIQEERDKIQEARDETLIGEILEDIKSNLLKVHEHGTRADGIVKSMLQHSRSSGNKIESKAFNPIVREFTNLAFHGMRAGKAPINVEIDLQLDPKVGEVKLISDDFSRVILNLCNNAFDAMRDKLVETTTGKLNYAPKLTISTKRTSETEIELVIGDNGKGIPEEILDKILEPFFTTKKGTEGTGLGLSISYDIIKAHGGRLEVRSKLGIGTEFIIQIPTDF